MSQISWFAGARPKPGRRGRLASMLSVTALASLLLAIPATAAAQATSIAGTVVAERSLRPLAAVQVQVAGTQVGTLTDENGRFVIDGLTGQRVTLRVVRIGYATVTQEVTVGSRDIEIQIAPSAISLDEMVVTGTAGGQQRRAIGNSVATVRASDVVERAPVRSVQDLINARAPGVVVMPGTGQVGSGSNIRIRGTSTFSLSSDPLIYVDGVRVNNETSSGISVQAFGSGVVSRLNDFDPNQIESIEILKGPAAATLYGTEAARGVINIITKQGAAGAARFSLTLKQGFNQFQDASGRMPVNHWRAPSGEVVSLNVTERAEAAGAPLFRTGHVQGYSLNVSGGTENIRYFLSGDLNKDQGVEPTNYQDQFSGRANVQVTPSEKVNINLNMGYTDSETGLSCEGGCGGTMWTSVFSTPQHLPEYNCGASPDFGCDLWGGYRSGPPSIYHDRDMNQTISRFTGSVRLNYQPVDWFTNRLTVGTDVTNEHNLELMPYQSDELMRYFWGETTGNGYRYETRRAQNLNTFDYVGTAEFDATETLSSSTSLGVQYYARHIEMLGAQGNEFAGPGLVTIDAAARISYAGSDYLDNNTLGFYLQEVVSWNDRLFLTGAVRVDNNSAFGSDLDFVTYPKASLAWVLTEEPSLQPRIPEFLNTFKLRLAYGHSGSQPVALSALRTFSPVTGPGSTPAVTPATLGNPELGPERGQELEAGFDASLLDERVGVEFTYYHTRTKDGILLRPIAPSTGYPGSRWVNAGQILNTGMEALVTANLLERPRFGWDMNFSLATNKGTVEQLAGGDTTIVNGSRQYRIGHEPNAFFRERVVSADYDAGTDQVSNVMCDDGIGGSTPCFNGAGQVIAPRVYLGRSTPSLEGAVGSNFRFLENFTLNAMVDFKTGYMKTDNNRRARCQVFRTCLENMNPADYPPEVIAQMRTSGTLVDFAIQDASFARLREVSLTYDVPTHLAQQFGGRSARVNLAARNLHTWTDYTGLDPEAVFMAGGASYLEQSQLPQLLQFIATFNVNF